MADPKAPYGDVAYADPGYQADHKKRYPLDKKHIRAALSYIATGQDKDKYSPEDYAKVRAAIDAAAKKFGITVNDHDGDEQKSASVDGAVREDTPSTGEPEDAALPGTSRRDAVAEETTRATPEPVQRKAIPMNMDELKARQAEIATALTGIGEEFRDAALPDEKQTEWDTLLAEKAKNDKTLADIEARAETLKGLATRGTVERGADRGAPAVHIKQDDIYDVSELRSMAYNGEDFLRKVEDNAKRAIDGAKFGNLRGYGSDKETAQEYATELLTEVDNGSKDIAKRMLATGSAAYERAFAKVVRHGSDAMCDNEERQALLRAQTLGTDSSGGYAIPFQLDPTIILNNAGVTNPIRDLARVERIVGKEYQVVTSAGVSASRDAEGSQVAESDLTLARPVVRTQRVDVFVPFTYEADLAWGALRTEITKTFVDAKEREEDSFITGDGVTTSPPTPGGVVGSFVNAGGAVTLTDGDASLSPNDIYKIQTALSPRWERNATWMTHKGIANRMRQFDTAGGAQLLARLGEGKFYEILGYPLAYASAMASTLTTGSNIAVYGDFQQFLIVDRIGMNVELVPQIFGANQRPTGQRGVFAVWMNNSIHLNAAASGGTSSAFVVLQTS